MACKVLMFARSFGFQFLSHVIIAVAFHRLWLLRLGQRGVALVPRMMTVAYVAAALVCAPQLLVWTTVRPFPNSHPDWEQCTDLWVAAPNHPLPISYQAYNLLHILAVFWLPLGLVLTAYGLLFYRLRRLSASAVVEKEETLDLTSASLPSNLRLPPCDGGGGGGAGVGARRLLSVEAASRRTLRTAALLTISYAFCWLPYNVLQTLKVLLGRRWYQLHLDDFHYLHCLVVLNSVLNPFIYHLFGRLETLPDTEYL